MTLNPFSAARAPQPAALPEAVSNCLERIDKIVVGKQTQVRLCVAALIARGHLLIEDLPGVGKTTLAQVLGRVMGLKFQRIQFTSDMLPADVLGVSVYEQASARFVFHPGPVFSQLVLADEINRASPRAQSALLEAMEERQITVEGETRPLPNPFFVVATQNPLNLVGTFPLPESQLDRFLMRIELGYPDAETERRLLSGREPREMLPHLEPAMNGQMLLDAQAQVTGVHASRALIEYVQALAEHTRNCGDFQAGLSPRAGLALLRAARAWAFMDRRGHVLPEDVQTVFPAVATHRLRPVGAGAEQWDVAASAAVLAEVPIP